MGQPALLGGLQSEDFVPSLHEDGIRGQDQPGVLPDLILVPGHKVGHGIADGKEHGNSPALKGPHDPPDAVARLILGRRIDHAFTGMMGVNPQLYLRLEPARTYNPIRPHDLMTGTAALPSPRGQVQLLSSWPSCGLRLGSDQDLFKGFDELCSDDPVVIFLS